MSRTCHAIVVFALGLSFVLPAPAADGVGVMHAFALDPGELQAAMAAIPVDEEHGVQVLLDRADFEIDAQQRWTRTYTLIYRVDSKKSVSSWSRASQSWEPWHESRPTIEARVITASGAVFTLDPETLGEYSTGKDGPSVYDDGMTLRGPLPGVDVGSIVEEVRTVADDRPFFEAGAVRSFRIGRNVPVVRSVVTVSWPPSIALEYNAMRLPEIEVTRGSVDGVNRIEFVHGASEGTTSDAPNAPGHIARFPMIAFSSGESWQSVATAYAGIVDRQLGTPTLSKQQRKLIEGTTDRTTIARRLLAALHERVRYTGVEFGENSIVPAPPAETLERGFGDCKDKSSLLVSTLRAAGIEAHLALLNTGPGQDIDPELPGMGKFDHAIVYMPGEPEYWVDPTHPFAPLGEIPGSSQGRLALIASSQTTQLRRTPKATSAENHRKEIRRIQLVEDGPGRLVESTVVHGSFGRRYRSSFEKLNDAELRERFAEYLKAEYQAKELDDFKLFGLVALDTPLELELVSGSVEAAWCNQTEAGISLRAGSLFKSFPKALKPDEDEAEPRKFPYLFQEPYRLEIEYVVTPPLGYAALTLPENVERKLGPARMTETYRRGERQSVVATIALDTGADEYSVEEAHATKLALTDYFKMSSPSLVFQQTGEALLEAGDIRGALAEFRRLVELDGEEPRHRTRIARALLAAGLGIDARKEARAAVKLRPESLEAQRQLGITLAHDDWGRKFNEGFLRDEAVAALRKARALDETDYPTAGELAIVLEYAVDGTRYTDPKSLTQAIDVHLSIVNDLERNDLLLNLLATLLHARRFEEIEPLWEKSGKSASLNAQAIAARAAVEGAGAAIAEASRVTGTADAYRQALILAADWLDDIREYALAAELLAAGAVGSDRSVELLAEADLLRRTVRYETISLDPGNPDDLVRAFNVASLAPTSRRDNPLVELIVPLTAEVEREFVDEFTEFTRSELRTIARQNGLSPALLLDRMLSAMTYSVEDAGADGIRVRVSTGPGTGYTLFGVKQGKAYRLIGISGWTGLIGERLDRMLDDGRLEEVRRWLDWMAEESGSEGSADIVATPPIRKLWRPDGDMQAARAAVAALLADGTFGEKPLKRLRELRAGATDGRTRIGLDLAILGLSQQEKNLQLQAEVCARILEQYPASTMAATFHAYALSRSGQPEAAEAALERAIGESPYDKMLRSVQADIALHAGKFELHRSRSVALIDGGKANPSDYNNLAWLDIVEDRVSASTLALAQQATKLTDYSDPGSLHTLATVYAELDRLSEARDVLMALLEFTSGDTLNSADWYVLGRIAEGYGATETALMAYEHVEPPDGTFGYPTSTRFLADRRTAALQTTPE